jgi:N utilization substance protein B
MLTRRQLRIKVMQALFYYQRQKSAEISALEKFLNQSMTDTFVLFLYMSQLLAKFHELAKERHELAKKRHLATPEERNPSTHLIDNWILKKFSESEALKEALDKRKLKPWELESNYIDQLYQAVINSKEYVLYTSSPESTRKEDLQFVLDIYTEFIAPNDKILAYLEDQKITWTDDFPLINSFMLQYFRKLKPNRELYLPELVKDSDDSKFTMQLLRKSVMNYTELHDRLSTKASNWDKDRIAQIDQVLIIMAQTEFLYFPFIPVKVTLNEYLEIAKDYSSPKSNTFINGILDNMLKEFQDQEMLNKMGRGLM